MRASPGAAAAILLALGVAGAQPSPPPSPAAEGPRLPDVQQLPDDESGRRIRLGQALVVKTPALIGPEVDDPAKRYAGNNLACENCHLDAGARALPLTRVFNRFPRYRAREGRVISLEERLNGCVVRSLNGRPLPAGSAELQALVAYLGFLARQSPAPPAPGAPQLEPLDRPADPARGARLYARACSKCHLASGQGTRNGDPGDAQGYAVPPLWGKDSFNDGAGMARLGEAASFIFANMPPIALPGVPPLRPADAWDIAAFVEAHPRPHLPGLSRDFPRRAEKPADAPYGPYVDGFPRRQHRLGPFGPIRKKLLSLARRQPR